MENFKQRIASGHDATPKPKRRIATAVFFEKSNPPIHFLCCSLLFKCHLKNLSLHQLSSSSTLLLCHGLSCDKSIPGTEKAECLEQLSHHYAQDILLKTFFQTETCYSFIEVNNIDAEANIGHSCLSNRAFLATLSQSHPNSTRQRSHPTASHGPLQTGLHPKRTLDRGLLTFCKGHACQ
jgi:hypothetical protein